MSVISAIIATLGSMRTQDLNGVAQPRKRAHVIRVWTNILHMARISLGKSWINQRGHWQGAHRERLPRSILGHGGRNGWRRPRGHGAFRAQLSPRGQVRLTRHIRSLRVHGFGYRRGLVGGA